MQAKNRVLAAVFGGLVIALVVIGSIVGIGQAAPPAVPTPLANPISLTTGPLNVTFQSATAIAADTNTSGVQLPAYGQLALQYTIDQGTVNTTTITLQYSNDNTNWFNGLAVVSANAADTTDGIFLPLGWRYVRFNQDVANSNPITITMIGVAK